MALAQITTSPLRRALKKRKPSRAVRRSYSAKEPRAATLKAIQVLHEKFTRFEAVIERLLFPVLEPFLVGTGTTSEPEREDANLPRFVGAKLEAIELNLEDIFREREIFEDLDLIGKRVATKNGNELRRLIGISILDADPGVGAQIANFRSVNISRIKSLAGTELIEITQLLERATATGARVEVLRKAIEDRFAVTRSKAALLARDQVLTLNGQITRTRQTNVGIQEYIWTTSGDELVRDRHIELDGTAQRWDTPPIISDDGRTGHPADDYQCRCVAFPVLPELA